MTGNRPVKTALIAGNWKMNLTAEEGIALVQDLAGRLGSLSGTEVLLLPPFPILAAIGAAIGDASIELGGQNLHWEASGPYTGEVSGPMLRAAGCRYVLVGHSERRSHFGETDRTVNRKVRAALECGLRVILAVGENEEERAAGRTRSTVQSHLLKGLEGVAAGEAGRIEIAYEPIWAIGTGTTATVEQAGEVHGWLRDDLRRLFPPPADDPIRILYGGSVTPENVDTLMACPEIDGVLVGGASLQAESFARIARFQKETTIALPRKSC